MSNAREHSYFVSCYFRHEFKELILEDYKAGLKNWTSHFHNTIVKNPQKIEIAKNR